MAKCEIKAGELVWELTRERDEASFVLHDARVLGKLDLRNRSVAVAVDLRGCEFEGEADLRYSEFAETLDLRGCVFRKGLNSGDEIEAHTVYRKDLICNGVAFEGTVGFNGCRVEGSAYFWKAKFGGPDKHVDFSAASIGKTFECQGATFEGPVSFAALDCGGTGFFANARFKSTGIFEGTDAAVLFSSATFGNNLVCDGAVFAGAVDLERLKCGGGAVFRRARFEGEGEVRFVQASVGGSLECQGATFEGRVVFNSAKCGLSGFFANAVFQGTVELGYARFGGVFDCPGATFTEWTNLGSLECASLDCNGAVFYGPTNLNMLRCHGNGHFQGTRFRDEIVGTTFGYASFAQDFVCDGAVFEGSAFFASLKCGGNAFFRGAEFRGAGEVNFKHASIGGNLECQNAVCDGPANFESLECGGHLVLTHAQLRGANLAFASVGETLACIGSTFLGPTVFDRVRCRNLSCAATTFDGPAAFNSLACADGGNFDGARFYGETRFGHASFGVSLSCDGAAFRAPTDFDSLNCGSSAFFRNARFDDVDFRHAALGKNLSCDIAIFNGSVGFQEMECGGSAFFNGARFFGYEANVSWAGASVGGNLECQNTFFNGSVSLNRVTCEGSTMFDGALFLSRIPARFEFSHFGRNLSFRRATFAGPVDMSMTRVTRRFTLSAARLRGETSFYGARIGVLALEAEGLHFEKASLDLRDLVVERFLGNKRTATAFVRAQDPTKFSRDPYLQLERYYESAGDEAEAKTVHYRGRRDLRENAKSTRGATEWPVWTRWGDWWLKWLTGYGTRTWLLLIPVFLFLVAGTIVFWSDDASAPRASTVVRAAASGQPAEVSRAANGGGAASTWQQPFDPVAYSLDLFLPVVNLRVEERWGPVGSWREAYAVVHAMAGWLLVPLLVASLAGIVRRRQT